ncbi:oxygen-independent coproporphyrinogen III oxidase [Rossellomorea vietnamensis]|uniref:Heme chaperone HemW n=1 Tax=Rossellomorea vietnamensis TaxID=218284 RepID=A0A5D4KF62_9BACI|nr:radical SAM family heme chaperone HemW [Rossellomorea vietnamensis]TYR75460.1 oxygen-independent coproporphyrinogen III oxidase [Rossellomorea vietnamensis]
MIRSAYIHIPFCHHICHYCDFNKVFMKGQPVDDYLASLDKEMKMGIEKYPSEKLSTIFVGGGTPTALNASQLEVFCKSINASLPYSKDEVEFTFEANPGDLTSDKLEVLHDHGVNRLSFGVQSFNDDLLERIGRNHRSKDVYTSIDAARKAGFDNISIDLIYALPGQTVEDFKHTLRTALEFDLPHYSGYSLIIEPKTVFYNLMRKGKLSLPPQEAEAEMYSVLMEEMQAAGINQYEISNFAKKGYESKHNLVYWDNEEYYGFGAGAHGYAEGNRYSNFGPLKKYMEPLADGKLPIIESHEQTTAEKMEEEMFLGLRKTEGVSVARFTEKFGESPMTVFKEAVEEMVEKELLSVEDAHIRLTQRGKFLGNEVFQAFLGVI